MAQHKDSVRIDGLLSGEQLYGSNSVQDGFVHQGALFISGKFLSVDIGALVETVHGDPQFIQAFRDILKRSERADPLIAVVGTGAVDQYNGGEWAAAFGESQGTGKLAVQFRYRKSQINGREDIILLPGDFARKAVYGKPGQGVSVHGQDKIHRTGSKDTGNTEGGPALTVFLIGREDLLYRSERIELFGKTLKAAERNHRQLHHAAQFVLAVQGRRIPVHQDLYKGVSVFGN